MVLEYIYYLNAKIGQGATTAKIRVFLQCLARRIFVLLKRLIEMAPIKEAVATQMMRATEFG
ncbi:hypothetical protein CU665_19925 [Pseudomonas syringae pv. actinidifoliorum]|nr:hypothetical protein [Pseudomonas syringae pv. actinidifoliorum]NAT38609.1 hypothetical protein [Pseudomonas syringae pv. actinidifoliorum]